MRSRQRFLPKIFESINLLWLIVFAYQIAVSAGEKGFFAFDQSIVFDGSYRIYSGQIPYKDFLIPFGPVLFWLQGTIFKILGVSYSSYIFGAALINVLTTIGAYSLLRMLFPNQKVVAYLGSILTATWFYPPFGTPWMEQTAYFFCFTALLCVIAGLLNNRIPAGGKMILFFVSGLLSLTAFLSKQNAGALFVPVYGALFLAANHKSLRKAFTDIFIFASGWLAGLFSFWLWLITQSESSNFMHYFFEIPVAEVAADRLPVTIIEWTHALLIGYTPRIITTLSIASALIAIIIFFTERKSVDFSLRENKPRLLAATLAPSLFLYHNIFLITSNNHVKNSIPFIGLIAAIGFGLLIKVSIHPPLTPPATGGESKQVPLLRRTPLGDAGGLRGVGSEQLIIKHRKKTIPPAIMRAASALMLIVMTATFFFGVNSAPSRQNAIFKHATFPSYLTTEKLSALRWGEPTRIGKVIHADDIDQLASYLDARGENFFIFPDFTIFYGLLNVPSPQPLVWFHEGLTYTKTYDPTLDDWIVSDLQKNQVKIVILEEESWFHTDQRLDAFPQLKSYISNNFVSEDQIGNFIIYAQKSD
ncbi:MAG: glycosyltransferase family 39 protein [Chloroflexota bacterium]|nr:glycosyltransferase family 39 protein [Chloroflexota bacterium]